MRLPQLVAQARPLVVEGLQLILLFVSLLPCSLSNVGALVDPSAAKAAILKWGCAVAMSAAGRAIYSRRRARLGWTFAEMTRWHSGAAGSSRGQCFAGSIQSMVSTAPQTAAAVTASEQSAASRPSSSASPSSSR